MNKKQKQIAKEYFEAKQDQARDDWVQGEWAEQERAREGNDIK